MFLNVLTVLFQGEYLCCTQIKKPSNNELVFICESYYVVSPILFTTALTIQLSWELELGNPV